jgi:hypothetical protein
MKILVHTVNIGDVEDPEIYAAEPLYDWEHTEQGQWLQANSYQEMCYTIKDDPRIWGHRVYVWAWLKNQELTYYTLRWGDTLSHNTTG